MDQSAMQLCMMLDIIQSSSQSSTLILCDRIQLAQALCSTWSAALYGTELKDAHMQISELQNEKHARQSGMFVLEFGSSLHASAARRTANKPTCGGSSLTY